MPPRRAAAAAAQAMAAAATPTQHSKASSKPGKRKPLVPGRRPTLVLDNGGQTIKIVWVDGPTPSGAAGAGAGGADGVKVVLNAITRAGPKTNRKTFVADELENQCKDYDKLQYRLPMDKGILADWGAQKLIWDHVLGEQGLNVDFANTRLLVTEAPFSLPNVQDAFDQMIFEGYEFAEYLRVPSALLTAFGPPPPLVGSPPGAQPKKAELPEAALIIESGYSFTHAIPVMDGNIVWRSVRRLDIGGKLITNYLKELLSFRHLYMMDQTHVVNHVKESLCYVAQDYSVELRRFSDDPSSITLKYALPDFTDLSDDPTYKLGYVKDGEIPPPPPKPPAEQGGEPVPVEEQVIELGRERFEVMELLFQPDVLGLQQAGLHEVVRESIESLPDDLQGLFWANMIAVGGNFRCPGMLTRLQKELRAVAPDEYEIGLQSPSDPVTYPAVAASFALNSAVLHGLLDERFVSRQGYLGSGSSACREAFGGAYAVASRSAGAGTGTGAASAPTNGSGAETGGLGGHVDEGGARAGKGGGGGGGGRNRKFRKTSSGEEDELEDILEGDGPEYIVRSTASRKRKV